MRHFIVVLHTDGPAYIAAETVDGIWARENLLLARRKVVLSETEMRLDPDMAPVLDAWESKDDRAWAAEELIDEAQSEDWGPPKPAASAGMSAAERDERMAEISDQTYNSAGEVLEGGGHLENAPWEMAPELALYYRLSAGLSRDIHRYAARHDPEEAAGVARYVAVELLNEHAARRGVKPL